MIKAVQRNVAFFGGLIASGWVCALAAPWLVSPRGDVGPMVLQSQSPALSMVIVAAAVLGASVIAGFVGKFTNAAVGVFVLGAGVFVLAAKTHTIRELAFASSGGSSKGKLALLAIETLLWAALCLGAVLIVFAIAGRLSDIEPIKKNRIPHPLWSGEAMRAAIGGAAVIPLVLLIAKSPMKGQAIGATFLGSMVGGLIGRLLSPHVQPVLLFVSPIVFGALAHAAGLMLVREPLDVAYVERLFWATSMPMPIDYAAGSLMGVSMGLGWARSFLHHEDQPLPAHAT